MMMSIGSLFAGIGGLELGLEWSGVGHTTWQVEQSEFCRSILAKHWPHAKRYEDVCHVGSANLAPVDLICGGFPCQDVSSAGKGAGLTGERSGLWREFARIVTEIRPRWVVVENVASGAQRWLDVVVRDLAERGYEVLPVPLSAADVGAPHLRRRIFVVAGLADPDRVGVRQQPGRGQGQGGAGSVLAPRDGSTRAAADAVRSRLQGANEREPQLADAARRDWSDLESMPEPAIRRVADGVPRSLGSTRNDELKALGNSVVPQDAEVIGWVIRELMEVR